MFRRKVRSIEMKRYTLLDHTDQAKCLICQRSDVFKRFYIVQGSFKTNQEVYVETESKQLAIKIWSMTRRCCPLTRRCCLFLRKFQLGSYWTYHTPSNWSNITQMLHKMNYTTSYSDVIQQNKIWANMAVV